MASAELSEMIGEVRRAKESPADYVALPPRDAYFCHVAGDSNDNGVVWAYRHKK
jgi:hypothetical protein